MLIEEVTNWQLSKQGLTFKPKVEKGYDVHYWWLVYCKLYRYKIVDPTFEEWLEK